MIKNSIKVSIIVPVYNVEIYLKACLDTIVRQSLKEIEIILINDCSTDNSKEICENYLNTDNRIILINNETNIKQGLSRNIGIKVAKGEFIGFVDPDDMIDLDYFEKLYVAATSNNTNIAKAAVSKVYDDTIILQPKLNHEIQKSIRLGEPLCLIFDYEHWAGIYKRDLIIENNVKYANIRNAEDNYFLLQATYFLKTITIVNNTMYYYKQHPTSTESIREKVYYESILECFNLHVNFIEGQSMEKELYNKIFLKGFNVALPRYLELRESIILENYEQKYFNKIFDILLKYKYEIGDILSGFYDGYRYLKTKKEIEISKVYLLSKMIIWFPRKASNLLELIRK